MLLDSGDPRIWRLAIDNEKTVNEKEIKILNMIKRVVFRVINFDFNQILSSQNYLSGIVDPFYQFL